MAERNAGQVLAVIPARGGSKRIPGKNWVEFAGRPMIQHTIRAAMESGRCDRIVVSTDDETIARIATEVGAEVPFMREPSIADDHTPVSVVTVDALERLDPDGTTYSSVVQLMPNCPLRTAADVRESHDQFVRTGSDSQLSVFRFGWANPWWAMRRDEQMILRPLFEKEATARSQDLPALFCPTGAVWWAKAEVLRRERTFHVPGRTGWEISWEHGIDIDSPADLELARGLAGVKGSRA